MIQVRRNVFETNSSSTHSLAVPQNYQTYNIKKRKLVFHLGSFGRPCKTVKVKATDYLYTAIMCDLNWCFYSDDISKEERDNIRHCCITPNWKKYCKTAVNRLNKLKEILDNYGLKYEFEEPVWDVEYDWAEEKSYDFLREEKYGKKESWTSRDLITGKIVNKYYSLDRSFGIDHSDEVEPLVDMLLANPEECIKFLLGGMVFVGSDESDDLQRARIHWNKKTYSDYYYFDTKKNKEVKRYNKNVEVREKELPNPYYMEGYNYYYKGN